MGASIKMLVLLMVLVSCMQLISLARVKRDDTSAKNSKPLDNIDVNALGNMILERLKENLKDSGDTVKNILNSARNSLQQNVGGMQAGVAAA